MIHSDGNLSTLGRLQPRSWWEQANWEAEEKDRSWLKAARRTRPAPEEGQSQDPPQNGVSGGGAALFSLQRLARALPEAAAPKWVIVAARCCWAGFKPLSQCSDFAAASATRGQRHLNSVSARKHLTFPELRVARSVPLVPLASRL